MSLLENEHETETNTERVYVGGCARHTHTEKNHNLVENSVFSGFGGLLYLSFDLCHHRGRAVVMVGSAPAPRPALQP